MIQQLLARRSMVLSVACLAVVGGGAAVAAARGGGDVRSDCPQVWDGTQCIRGYFFEGRIIGADEKAQLEKDGQIGAVGAWGPPGTISLYRTVADQDAWLREHGMPVPNPAGQ